MGKVLVRSSIARSRAAVVPPWTMFSRCQAIWKTTPYPSSTVFQGCVCLLFMAFFLSPAVRATDLATAPPQAIVVHTSDSLKKVLREPLTRGTHVRIAPGRYTGYHSLYNKSGTADAPIVITALDPQNPPVFADSPTVGLQVINCKYVTIQNLQFEDNGDIGLHIAVENPPGFDTLSSSHHIIVENVTILDTGIDDWGNHDGLKIGGTDHFIVRGVSIRGWGAGGGSAVDIVGSQYGLIEDSTFEFNSQSLNGNNTGVTVKGGSRDIVLRRNLFDSAGLEVIQIGQDTGIQYFRSPPGTLLADGTIMNYEAKGVEVYANTIVGGTIPIMWMKSTQSYVHHNTIVMPKQSAWESGYASPIARSILKITGAANDGLARANQGRFESNLIVYYYGGLQKWSQPFVKFPTDGDPSLATFTFANNAWYQLDVPTQGLHLPNQVGSLGLPSAETNPIYQVDPELAGMNYATGATVLEEIRVRSSDRRLRDVGADSHRRSHKPAASGNPAPAGLRQPR